MPSIIIDSSPFPEDGDIPAFSPAINPGIADVPGLSKTISVPAQTILVAQGEKPQTIFLIRSGIVLLSALDVEGETATLGLRSEGWWVGGCLALLSLHSLCEMRTLTECELSSMEPAQFLAQLMSNSSMLQHFLTAQSRELIMVQQHSIMRGSSAAERLKYLQGEHTRSIWETVDPTLVMRENEIARLLSITPEHLSRLRGKERRTEPRSIRGRTG